MLVLASVPDLHFQRLRAAGRDRYSFVGPATVVGMLDAIRSEPIEMAVVDPLHASGLGVTEIERLRFLFPSLPILIYTSLVPETAEVLLALGRLGIRRALFARFDDAPHILRHALQQELEHTAFRQVTRTLGALLDTLPGQLRWALETTLQSPETASTVSSMAERARVGRRTCERWFARSGLPTPRMVLVVARLLYAHRLLLDPGFTVDDVAAKLGYTRTRTMQAHLREVFGMTAGEMRLSLTPDDALEIVKHRYFPDLAQAAS